MRERDAEPNDGATSSIPPRVRSLLDDLALALRTGLPRNLIGLYLYGSLTQNAFDPRRSDIDCVVVLRHGLSRSAMSRLRAQLRRLRARQPLTRRLQLTLLIERELLRPNGDGWLYQFGRLTRSGSDGNPIIWTNISRTGVVIVGPEPDRFLPPITPAIMGAALIREAGYLRAELVTKRRSPWRSRAAYRRYATLTLCRLWYTRATGRVTSKRTAALWAIRRLPPPHRAIVRRVIAGPAAARWLPLNSVRALLYHVEVKLSLTRPRSRGSTLRGR